LKRKASELRSFCPASALAFTNFSLEAVIWKKDKMRQSSCQPTVQLIKPLAQLLPHINAAYIISPLTNHNT
jgi:hypothetical protein